MSYSLLQALSMVLILTVSNMLIFNSLAAENTAPIKDYGVRGHVFPIMEQSMLEVIMEKLKSAKESGYFKKLQQEFVSRVKKKIARPVPALGLHKATKNRIWLYDPTFTQETAIKDQNGKIIVEAGTSVNPLHALSWGEPLLLIDGDDLAQVAWASSQQGKLVLTNGNPIELGRKLEHPVYFDQGGILTKKFKMGTAIE